MQVDNNKETTVERETRIHKIWEEERTFHASISNRSAKKPFVFYEGPPTANNTCVKRVHSEGATCVSKRE
ncbi:isoleucyl-tRNA synthetase [Lysinibacillus sphaericus]|uniref:Isoleucyl-tRNA synthetase n=1 Tax=Lysinibacillus sphaericus TaxID=1421 RepID=A0A2S0K149_LYSSH|nr:hypothetical protein [Lysinibacillus sphaericus]AVK97061.1 hypothetical protein LS41612_12685 [Lysinibacillus sphaericus]UDK96760.1 hypothetical protein EYB33_10820 [Lysinibacillus sphaericus]GEC81374.1 hypothetical protein LSP03_11170 [Lysinibacillus sphaericus]SUV17083.1 isoleucyl-tRNA synthetase [Lysinibacillus sphaericus]